MPLSIVLSLAAWLDPQLAQDEWWLLLSPAPILWALAVAVWLLLANLRHVRYRRDRDRRRAAAGGTWRQRAGLSTREASFLSLKEFEARRLQQRAAKAKFLARLAGTDDEDDLITVSNGRSLSGVGQSVIAQLRNALA